MRSPCFEQLAPFADQWLCTDVSASGPVSRTVGDLLTNLGRYDEAEQQFERPTLRVRNGRLVLPGPDRLLVGSMLVRRGWPEDRARAREASRPGLPGRGCARVRHGRTPGGRAARRHRVLSVTCGAVENIAITDDAARTRPPDRIRRTELVGPGGGADRPLAAQGHPVHDPALTLVVEDPEVHGGPVVPEGQCPRLPVVAHHERRVVMWS